MNDVVTTTTQLAKGHKDGSRFTFLQEIFRSDGIKAAVLHIDGAWLDLEKRKLMIPPNELQEKLKAFKRTEDYKESI
jgi:acyl-CoA thioester hydrolase